MLVHKGHRQVTEATGFKKMIVSGINSWKVITDAQIWTFFAFFLFTAFDFSFCNLTSSELLKEKYVTSIRWMLMLCASIVCIVCETSTKWRHCVIEEYSTRCRGWYWSGLCAYSEGNGVGVSPWAAKQVLSGSFSAFYLFIYIHLLSSHRA